MNQLWVIILLLLLISFCGGSEKWSCSFAATHSTNYLRCLLLLFFYFFFSFGHHFAYIRGLYDQFYRMCNTISDHLGNYVKCVRFCYNYSMTHHLSRVLHDHVNVVDPDLDSCGLNALTCCSCNSMDRLVTGCSHGQCAQFLNKYNFKINKNIKWQ